MKALLNELYQHHFLSRERARNLMHAIADGAHSEVEIAALLSVFRMRTLALSELQGFRDALLERCVPVPLNRDLLIDIVGTGGDGKNTFNISTLSCFLVAGAGYAVAKHGNYAATSVSGSSNVMQALGYTFPTQAADVQRDLDRAGICFLHAPLFHPALKVVAPVRKQLGVRTIFNLLGPLVNPARPQVPIVGVYNAEIARMYSYLLQEAETRFTVINSMDAYDEVSLTADARIITAAGEQVWSPVDLGFRQVFAADLHGGETVEDAAAIFLSILQGKGTWAQNAVVLANAAVAMHATGKTASYADAYQRAVESLESGKALNVLKQLTQQSYR